jgi:hypothetical protein
VLIGLACCVGVGEIRDMTRLFQFVGRDGIRLVVIDQRRQLLPLGFMVCENGLILTKASIKSGSRNDQTCMRTYIWQMLTCVKLLSQQPIKCETGSATMYLASIPFIVCGVTNNHDGVGDARKMD